MAYALDFLVDEFEGEFGSDSASSEFQSDEDPCWIAWFCGLKGNEFFCNVSEEYIQDSFNLTGLNSYIRDYNYSLDMILDLECNDDSISEEQQENADDDARMLYGLIHARYILTSRGLALMNEKYRQSEFGCCPRCFCDGQRLLPVGLSELPNKNSVKLFCPKCEDIYNPRSSKHEHIDGAYFGTTFPHLFFLVYPEWKPKSATGQYIPRVFGFKLHSTSHERSLEAKEEEKKQKKSLQKIEY